VQTQLDTKITASSTDTLTNKTLTDSTTYLQDDIDNTKKVQFQLSGITTATTRILTVPDASTILTGTNTTQTLTNKTIDADNNTITNIDNANIKSAAAIDASKIADGTVSSTEFQYINSLSSNAQTQLDTKITVSSTDTLTNKTWGDNLDMNNNKIINVATPTADGDVTSKSYVDGVAQGLSVKDSVRATTTATGTLATSFENGDSIDGVTLATNDRILIKNQSTASENGIYIVQAVGIPTRAADLNTGAAAAGIFVFVQEGTVNADLGWVCTTDSGSDVVGTNSLVFTQFSGAGQISAGDGLIKTGNTLDVDLKTSGGLTVESDQLAVDLGASSITGTLVVGDGGTGATTLTSGNFLQGNGTSAVTASKTVPTGDVVGTTDTQTLTNKTLTDNTTYLQDDLDNTKKVQFQLSGITTATTRTLTVPDANTILVGTDATQTLTNKTIDADNNTITNIENADIKAAAAIDASKIADGTVSNTEFQYINSLTSNAQTQIDTKITASSTDTLTNKTLTDNTTYLQDDVDNTKKVQFQLSGITTATTRTLTIPDASTTLVGTDATQTLTNKTIDADNNTITNIENADIKASAEIDASKIADGTVSNTEFQYINSLTSNAQTQLDTKITASSTDTLTNKTLGDNLDMNSNKIINVATPTADGDVTSKSYVDGVAQGLSVKDSVRAATTATGTLATSFENGDSIDGVTLATNDRILIKNQSTASENGIYIVQASGAPTRADDLNTGAAAAGIFVFVQEGTANADLGWVCTTDSGSDVVGTNSLAFTQFSGAGQITIEIGCSVS